jgi:2,3-bisphosphoglycerate-dependent phosphoglycerate mutase
MILLLILVLNSGLSFYFQLPGENTHQAKWVTTVYLVRHAEKVVSDPSDQDPDLSPEGYQRAEALKERLKPEEIAAAFVTPYRRNRLTLAPMAQEKGIDLQTYDPHAYADLVKTVLERYQGQTVVVAGHSNSVLEIVEAFGAQRPVKKISEQDYDYLIRIRIPKKGKAKAEAMHYGQPGNGRK